MKTMADNDGDLRNRIQNPGSRLPLLALLLALLLPVLAAAEMSTLSRDPESRLSTVPHDPAMEQAVVDSEMDLVIVLSDGWRETVPSFARVKLYELTGRKSLHGQDPQYTILSMIYQNEKWHDAKVFPLGHPELGRLLEIGGKWVSAREVANNPNLGELMAQIEESTPLRRDLEAVTKKLNAVEQARRLGTEMRVVAMYDHEGVPAQEVIRLLRDSEAYAELLDRREELRAELDNRKPFIKAGEDLLNRVRLLQEMPSTFLVVPDTQGATLRWIRPVSLEQENPLLRAGRAFDLSLKEAFMLGRPEIIPGATAAFLDVIERSRQYPTQMYRQLKNYYVSNNPWTYAAWIYLGAALVYGLFFFFQKKSFWWGAGGLMLVGLLFHTAAVVIRGYLKGHVPVSNIFETLTFTSWCVMLIAAGFEAWNRKGMVGVSAASLGFLFLVAAALMPLHETRIHPLRAVLNSYWLNIHVTFMLISYAAFAISAVIAGIFLVRQALGREALFGGTPVMDQPQLEEFAYRLVQLGWPILTFGIALGAVWADTAWGRFWGWDPKETWAFITWVGYTVYLHTRMVMGWRGTWSAAACVLGFVLVLITWLGVSYIPMFSGGLHSYASPNTF